MHEDRGDNLTAVSRDERVQRFVSWADGGEWVFGGGVGCGACLYAGAGAGGHVITRRKSSHA